MTDSFLLRRSYAQALAVFIAVIISYFYAFSENYWMVLSAWLVMQTTLGLPVRQGLQQLLIFLLVVLIGTYVCESVSPFQSVLLGMAVICLSTVFNSKAWIFSIIFYIALIAVPRGPDIFQARTNDIAIGAAIGILIHLFVFPVRADAEFRKRVILLLTLYSRYLITINEYLLRKNTSDECVLQEKFELEKMLQSQSATFPSWVYQAGLSLTLRSGHRHFLIMMERVWEILSELHHIARHTFPQEIAKTLDDPLTHFVREAQKILVAISVVFTLNKVDQPVSDLKEEWVEIEKTINSLIPATFDITDQDPNYFLLINLLEDLNNLRTALISLGNSLQTAVSYK